MSNTIMISNTYRNSVQSFAKAGGDIQRIQDPTCDVCFAEAGISSVSTRDAKPVLRTSLERRGLGRARVGWIAVMLWTCSRAAFLTSTRFMMQQLCGRLVQISSVNCERVGGNGHTSILRGACNEYHCTILCTRRYRDNRESYFVIVE